MRLFFSLVIFIIAITSQAQEVSFQSFLLDKSLTSNADAIVRLDETDIDLLSHKNMVVKKRLVITVLRKAGNDAIENYAYYDTSTILKDLEVVVYNSSGKQIERIKKKDFHDISAVSGGTLYGDSRVKYFDYTPIAYPYTLDFQFSYETPNTAFMPRWNPIDDYRVSVEKSSFHVSNTSGIAIHKIEKNFEGYQIKNSSNSNAISYEVLNLPAVKKEMLSPSLGQLKPCLLLSLEKFHLEGVDGFGKDWKSFGKWQYDELLVGRDKLPSSTIAKINRLVSGSKDPLEKAKKIYEYVQNNTRYISVQLGIGGWMPISAEEVDRVKYGDCKGLTNYTKALLKSQGIESFYSVVYAGQNKRSIDKDFVSMQGNHVILNVPHEGRDVWLECTSQTIPFGFLGDFTDDRDVLVVTPEGGQIKHTATYLDIDNKKFTKADVVLTEEGSILADVAITSKGISYDERSRLERFAQDKKDKHYKEYWDNINGLKVAEIKSSNDTGSVEYVENVKVEAKSYASKAGNDLLFKVNVFDAGAFVPDRYRNRQQPFEVSRGFENEDLFTITLPDSYTISELPTPIKIENKFGIYQVNVSKKEDGQLLYKRKLLIKKGSYSNKEYKEYRDFRKTVAKNDNLKIVLTK